MSISLCDRRYDRTHAFISTDADCYRAALLALAALEKAVALARM